MDTNTQSNGNGRHMFKTEALYAQVHDRILQRIQSGEWTPNGSIPNEGDLAREYGVSSGTMRKALDQLEGEGFLVRRQGRGTFVCGPTEQTALPQTAREMLAALGVSSRKIDAIATGDLVDDAEWPVLHVGAKDLAAWFGRRTLLRARAA